MERLGQRIGVIGLVDCDDDDQWLVTAKTEASKLKKNDGLHMLIAMVGGDLDKVKWQCLLTTTFRCDSSVDKCCFIRVEQARFRPNY